MSTDQLACGIVEQVYYSCNGSLNCNGDQFGSCAYCDAKAPAALRDLADWLELHSVHAHEIIAVSANRWGERNVHLTLSAAARLWPGKTITFNRSGGHGRFEDGAFVVVVSDDRKQESYEVILRPVVKEEPSACEADR